MKMRWVSGTALFGCLILLAIGGWTGGQETSAEELASSREDTTPADEPKIDAPKLITSINPSIPIYTGATYRQDLSKRDSVMIQNQYGPDSEVYTLATEDSFPQVWHYYVTYLAQYRAYAPPSSFPPDNREWRTMEVHLNTAMRDPFIPGADMPVNGKQVILQLAETEAEPKTVIRYIVTPNAVERSPVLLQSFF